MRAPPPIKTHSKVCYDCDNELYPNGKIIFGDPLAKQDSKGRWHFFTLTDRRKTLLKIYDRRSKNKKLVIYLLA